MSKKEEKQMVNQELEAPADGASATPSPNSVGTSQAGVEGQTVEALTPEKVQELQTKAAKADEYYDRLLRQAADFDNFKKRAARERQDAIKFANQGLLEKLINVLDHFEMALVAANNNSSADLKSFNDGVKLIYNQLKTVLLESGLEEIDATQKPFDPNLHEAVSQQESADVPEGQVLIQLRKGYKLRERLIRPATVVVAKKPGTH